MTDRLDRSRAVSLERLLASAMVRAAPDGMAVIDEDGRLVLVNRQIEALFEYDADDLRGQPIEVLVPEGLRVAHEGQRAELQAEPRALKMGRGGPVLFGRRSDGSQVPVEVGLSPMQVGCRRYLVAAVHDVTERLEREAGARTIHAVLDAARDALLIFEHDTLQLVWANAGAAEQLGYTRDELLGMTQAQIKPLLGEVDYRHMIDTLSPGGSVTFSTVHRRKDGRDIDVEVTLQYPKLETGGGAPQLLISVARDVSKRREAERRLHAAEREIAVLDERQRIARDLHDRVIQRLFAAGLAASSITTRVRDPVVRGRIVQVVNDLDDTISDLRSSIFQLTAPAPDASLRKRVLDLCAAECDVCHITSNVRFSGPVDSVEPARGEELLAVLREALSNIVQHAHASTVDVVVTVNGGIDLQIQDDGVGLPEAGDRHVGHGLENMASRAHDLGGSFAIQAGSDAGTHLAWHVPGA